MTSYELTALGHLELLADGEPVPLRPAQRRVLARLAIAPGRLTRTEAIIETMWGEEAKPRSRNTLQAHVSGIRRQAPNLVATESDGYRLDSSAVRVDVVEFTELAHRALTPAEDDNWSPIVEAANAALDLWRGDPFTDIPDCAVASAARSELNELRLQVVERRIEALLAQGREEVAQPELQRLTHEHPLRERLWEFLMLCEYRLGRQADALRAYRRVSRILGSELGIEPGPRLKQLEDEILRHVPDAGRRALTANPTNLPRPMDALIGRDDTIQSLIEQLDRQGVVTLFGEGGLGKTRVAIELGWRAIDEHAGGVYLVELESAASALDVAAEIATTLQLSNNVGDIERLGHLLKDRPMLILLDGAEAIVSPVEAFCRAAAGSRLRVLVTRRSPPTDGTPAVRIEPLAIQPPENGDVASLPAARLLLDRARATSAEFRAADLTDDSITEILKHTRGTPLAIELAARWIGSVGPTDFAELRADIASSDMTGDIELAYRALPEVDRSVLRDMAALAGRGTLDTIGALTVAGEGRIVTAGSVARLRDAGLLTHMVGRSGHTLYGLHPRVREFVFSLDSRTDERTAALDRHAHHFRDLAQRADTFDLGDIDLRMPDFRLALEWWLERDPTVAATIADALAPYWIAKYLTWDGIRWYTRILAAVEKPRLESLWWFGWVAYHGNEHTLALEQYSILRSRAPEGSLLHARAVYGRARLSVLSDRAAAESDLRTSLEVFRSEGADQDVIECLMALGLSHAGTGRSAKGRPLLEEALALLTPEGDARQRSLCHRFLSLAAFHDGSSEQARIHADQAVQIADSAADLRIRSGALLQLALVEATWGSIEEAARTVATALDPVPQYAWYDTMLVLNGALPVLERGGEHEAARNVVAFIDETVADQGWQPLYEHNPVYAEARSSLTPIPISAPPMAEVRAEAEGALSSIAGD